MFTQSTVTTPGVDKTTHHCNFRHFPAISEISHPEQFSYFSPPKMWWYEVLAPAGIMFVLFYGQYTVVTPTINKLVNGKVSIDRKGLFRICERNF